jgi:hypothetical protein
LAKAALPIAGRALGAFVCGPVGCMIGGKLASVAMAGRRLAPGPIRQGGSALSNTVSGKGGAAIGGELGEVSFASSATRSGKAESAHRAGN